MTYLKYYAPLRIESTILVNQHSALTISPRRGFIHFRILTENENESGGKRNWTIILLISILTLKLVSYQQKVATTFHDRFFCTFIYSSNFVVFIDPVPYFITSRHCLIFFLQTFRFPCLFCSYRSGFSFKCLYFKWFIVFL